MSARITLAQKKGILRCLERYAGGVVDTGAGICDNLCTDRHTFMQELEFFNTLMARATRRWKNYSGNVAYPVRGGQDAFYGHNDLWAGLQGKYRYELVDRLIAELKREMSRNHRSIRVSLKKKD